MVTAKSVRTAPPPIAEIIRITRLLPAGIDLPDVWVKYHELLNNKLDDLTAMCDEMSLDVENLRQFSYQNRQPVSLFFDLSYDFKDIPSRLINTALDLQRLDKPLLEEALTCSVSGLPREFLTYLDIPEEDATSILRRLIEKSNAGNQSKLFRGLAKDQTLMGMMYCHQLIDSINRFSHARTVYGECYRLFHAVESYRAQHPPVLKMMRLRPLTFPGFAADTELVIHDDLKFVSQIRDAFHGVSSDRLRICSNEKCGKVFWLVRKPSTASDGKLGCSRACSGVLRTRKWRDRTTPEQRQKYALNRKIREYKKELENRGVSE